MIFMKMLMNGCQKLIHNGLRLCVRLRSVGLCVGQLAQNRCYTLARLISRVFNWDIKPFSFLF